MKATPGDVMGMEWHLMACFFVYNDKTSVNLARTA
jgi:hypothetical protein